MNRQDLIELATGDIDVTIFKPKLDTHWKIQVSGEDVHGIGEILCDEHRQQCLFASLDIAHKFLRDCGFMRMIQVDG